MKIILNIVLVYMSMYISQSYYDNIISLISNTIYYNPCMIRAATCLMIYAISRNTYTIPFMYSVVFRTLKLTSGTAV